MVPIRTAVLFVWYAALSAQSPVLLQPHRPVRDRIGSAETRSYQIDLKAGQYLEIIAEQKGVHLVLRLFAPDGAKLLEIDSPTGPDGPEPLYFITKTAGFYRLETAAADPAAKPGDFEISITRLAKPSRKDRLRAEADVDYSDAGAIYFHPTAGEQRRCLELYQNAAQLFRKAGSDRDELYALQFAGGPVQALKENAVSLAILNRSLELRRKLKDRKSESWTLNQIAVVYAGLSQFEKAIAYNERALAIQREIKDREDEADSLNNLGAVYYVTSNFEAAISYHEQALKIRREIRDVRAIGISLNSLGLAYDDSGQSEKALGFYEESLTLFRAAQDRTGESKALNNIGLAYHKLGRYSKAIECFEQSLKIRNDLGDPRAAVTTLSNVARVYNDLGQYDIAIRNYEVGLKVVRMVKDRRAEGIMLLNLGIAYSEAGESEKALGCIEQALAALREVKERAEEAAALRFIGWIHQTRKDPRQALDYYFRALGIERENKTPASEGKTLNWIGSAYGDMGQLDQALDYLNQALTILREVKDRASEAGTLDSLRKCWQKLGQPRLASFYGKQAVNVLQTIRRDISGRDGETQQTYVKKIEGMYRGLADLLIAQGRLPEAQQVLNLLKDAEYAQFTRGDLPKDGGLQGRADLTADESDWATRYREVSEKLMTIGERYNELKAIPSRTAEQQAEYTRLEGDLAAGSRAFRQFLGKLNDHFASKVASSGDLGLGEIRDAEALEKTLRQLQHGAVAIYTLLGEDKYRAILVTPTSQRAYEYPIPGAELNRKIQAFREAVQNPHSDPRPIAEELYHILIVPALAEDLRQAKAETLMWYLDGALRYLPLSALYDGRQYLIERYRLAVFTPASKAELKDAPGSQGSKLLGLGVTKSYRDFPPLKNVASELHGIVRGEPDRELLDESFTLAAMRSNLELGYGLVHIATHFNFEPGNDDNSFLLLGDGNTLTVTAAKDIPGLFDGVELLTLSACNTGMGNTSGDGAEVEGFGVLAQRKGAKAVIATLWPVADESTSLLMQQFYHRLEATPRVMKSEALREAQLALLHGDVGPQAMPEESRGVAAAVKSTAVPRDYRHPYYWAPFFLMGNWL